MSALGQKRTLKYATRVSALPPEADIGDPASSFVSKELVVSTAVQAYVKISKINE